MELYYEGPCNSKEIDLLASLGSDGRYPNHMHSELTSRLVSPDLGQPLLVNLWCKVKVSVVAKVLQVMMLPHVLFAN
eukprot:3113235-Alexandrium_andersonii.AAC.1